jgi:hypothetical protein
LQPPAAAHFPRPLHRPGQLVPQSLPPYSESQTQAPVASSHEPWPLQTLLLLLGQAEALGPEDLPSGV